MAFSSHSDFGALRPPNPMGGYFPPSRYTSFQRPYRARYAMDYEDSSSWTSRKPAERPRGFEEPAPDSVWTLNPEQFPAAKRSVAEFASPTDVKMAMSVAGEFAFHYFHLMQTHPQMLHCFYCGDSQLAHGSSMVAHNKWNRATGEREIESLFASMLSPNIILRSNVKTLEAQPTRDGGIVMQATGFIETRDAGHRPFAHTIVMQRAPEAGSFVVLHDIFVFLDDLTPTFVPRPPTVDAATSPMQEELQEPDAINLMAHGLGPVSTHAAVMTHGAMTGPSLGMTGVSHGMTGASHGMTGASHGMTGASHGMTGASHGMTGASHGMTGVSHPMTGASHGMTGVSHGMTGASHGMTGASHGMTGASHGMTGASHGMTGASHGMTGASLGMTGASLGMTGHGLGGAMAGHGHGMAGTGHGMAGAAHSMAAAAHSIGLATHSVPVATHSVPVATHSVPSHTVPMTMPVAPPQQVVQPQQIVQPQQVVQPPPPPPPPAPVSVMQSPPAPVQAAQVPRVAASESESPGESDDNNSLPQSAAESPPESVPQPPEVDSMYAPILGSMLAKHQSVPSASTQQSSVQQAAQFVSQDDAEEPPAIEPPETDAVSSSQNVSPTLEPEEPPMDEWTEDAAPPDEPPVVEEEIVPPPAPKPSPWKVIHRPPPATEAVAPPPPPPPPPVEPAVVQQQPPPPPPPQASQFSVNSYAAKLLAGVTNLPKVRGTVLKRASESASTSPSTREQGQSSNEQNFGKAVWVSQLEGATDGQIMTAVANRLKGSPIEGRVVRIERMRNTPAGVIELDSEECVPILLDRGLCINGRDVRIDLYKQSPSQLTREPSPSQQARRTNPPPRRQGSGGEENAVEGRGRGARLAPSWRGGRGRGEWETAGRGARRPAAAH